MKKLYRVLAILGGILGIICIALDLEILGAISLIGYVICLDRSKKYD